MMDAEHDAWLGKARAVRIESELARRGVVLKGKPPELAGPCPVCGGTDRFSVHTGKQAFNCRGCGGKGGDAISLVRFLDGMDFFDAVAKLAGEPRPNGKTTSRPEPQKVVADRFDYHDETGALLYQVERIEFRNPDGSFVLKDGKRKKGFPQRRPDPDRLGEWIYNLDGVAPVPYRLPGLIEAIVNDALIVITEGERKADLLVAWGFTATCNSGGAMKWRPEHSAYLNGADIIILPDNDTRGQEHLDAVAASLKAVGATVRVLDLPGLCPKGDIVDWAAAGGTAERLHDLIEHDAKPWGPREANGHDTGERFLPPDRDRLILSAWLNRDIPERDYLLGNVMCTTSRWFVIGETGIGKTLFGGAMGGAAAKGASFLNWEARRPSCVMYLDGELPVETFKERMELIAARHGRDIRFFGYNREDLGFDGMPPLNTPAGQAWLRRETEAIKPDLILFDSIMCLLVGSMLDEATWAPMKPLVCELSGRHIAQVWFNHANDLGKSFGDKTRELEMDTVARLSKVEGDETAIRLDFIKARLRTPKTAGQFSPLIIRPSDDWSYEIAKGDGSGRKAGSVQRRTGLQDLDHALSHAVLPHWMLSIAFGSFATLSAAPALLLKKSRILGGVDELVDVARMA